MNVCHPEPVEGCHPEPVEGCHPEPVEGLSLACPESIEGSKGVEGDRVESHLTRLRQAQADIHYKY